jgi:integrase
LTPKFCEQFLAFLGKDLKPNSAAAYYARFKTVIKALVREGIIPQDPAIGVLVNRVASLPKFLTLEELRTLMSKECGNSEVRDAFLFSCYTGLRYQDIKALSWKQVRGDTLGYTQSKTGAEEIIPLSGSAMSLIERRKKMKGGQGTNRTSADGLVFELPRRSTVDKVLKTWGKRGGLNIPLSFHKARHTFATLALDADVDLYTTSKLLGHKTIATSQVYARVTDSKKKSAVAKFPRLE